MAEIIRMPRLSDTMEEGVIVEWHKKVGDSVSVGDVLAEVETDKATMDLESFQEGTLLYIGVEEGPVPVDGILAVIGAKGEDFKSLLENAEQPNGNESEASAEPKEQPQAPSTETPKSDSQSTSQSSTTTDDGRIKASPLAKKMASEKNIDLRDVTGSGDHGRIVKKDILEYEKSSPTTTPASAPAIRPASEKQIAFGAHPLSQMRKTIARRLSESKFTAPHFYLTMEIDMDEMFRARKLLNEKAPVKISFNDIIIKCVAGALQKHPMVNASWKDDHIYVNEEINIGVAVAVDEGLLVPVIKNADRKTLSYINTEVKELAELARIRRLQPDQMTGNTFTVSNLGMFGIEEFTAIINPPESCIMAVGGIVDKAVVKNGQLVPGKRMKVTMSCDHRVVDGATGAKFLQDFKMMMENPLGLML